MYRPNYVKNIPGSLRRAGKCIAKDDVCAIGTLDIAYAQRSAFIKKHPRAIKRECRASVKDAAAAGCAQHERNLIARGNLITPAQADCTCAANRIIIERK